VREYRVQVGLQMPLEMTLQLDLMADEIGSNRSELIRFAVTKYLEEKKIQSMRHQPNYRQHNNN
jgi:metal-responsive CopG/Arc/MetJ family transcriptional regulator